MRLSVQISAEAPIIMIGLSRFSTVPPGKFRDSTSHYAKVIFFHILSNLLFIDHHTTRSYILSATGSIVK
jgi:hypothetical protein